LSLAEPALSRFSSIKSSFCINPYLLYIKCVSSRVK
jgi:hypothetical protein